jgi:hypothetical protein
LIVTCKHVVSQAGAEPGQNVEIQFRGLGSAAPSLSALVTPVGWTENSDLSILRVNEPLPELVCPVELSVCHGRARQEIRALGFNEDSKYPTWADGRIIGTRPDGTLQLESTQITHGFSGGPIIDDKERRIFAIANIIETPDNAGRLPFTAYAIPTEQLKAIQPTLKLFPLRTLMDIPRVRGGQLAELWTRYFHHRVIEGLFAEPHDFQYHVALFRREAATLEHIHNQCCELATVLEGETETASSSEPATISWRDIIGQQLLICSDAVFENDLAEVLNAEDASGFSLSFVEPSTTSPLPLEEQNTEARRQPASLRWELQAIFEAARRATSQVWLLVAPAGRGKSTFVWELSRRLRDADGLLCGLVGPDLDGTSPLEDLIMRQLRIEDDTNFWKHGSALWDIHRRPLFILIDAINESRADPAAVANQLSTFLAFARGKSWLRILITCRDQYWDLFFREELQEFIGVLDMQVAVVPRFTPTALGKYLEHFHVRNVQPKDLVWGEWSSNPLLLRIFCETYQEQEYDGVKPIRMRGVRLLREYIKRKQKELTYRTFGSIDLESILRRISDLMANTKILASEEVGLPRFVLPVSAAQGALPERSVSGIAIYDSLLDMDLIFQVQISRTIQQYISFALERMQDYFLAISILALAEESREPITDNFFGTLQASGKYSESAISTALAIAIDRRIVQDLSLLKDTVQSTLTTLLDLVGAEALQPLEGSLLKGLSSEDAIRNLRAYLRTQMQWQTAQHRAFPEVFGAGLLAEAVFKLSLIQRHRLFYADRRLVDAMASVLEVEIESMRDWVRRRFREFPAYVSTNSGRLKSVVLLLGSNSPQVRDIAHEWLFWIGHFQSSLVCDIVESYLAIDDLLVRERILALYFVLLKRHPALATLERLERLYKHVLDPKSSTYTPHYLIVEFARKTLLAYRDLAVTLMSGAEWNHLATPRRVRITHENREIKFPNEPRWERRGPIDGDQSHYTFGHQFSCFSLPDTDLAVRTALRVLPRLGYKQALYEDLDDELARFSGNDLYWNRSEHRFERFGKTCAYVASWVVLGLWAGRKPISRDVAQPEQPLALRHPPYDYGFSVEPSEASEDIPILDFLETQPWEEWARSDERIFLHKFAAQFPDEEILWGLVKKKKGDRQFITLTKSCLIAPEMVNSYAWATEYLLRYRESFLFHLPEEHSEDFDFFDLSDEQHEPVDEHRKIVAGSSERIRTLGNADKSVITASARLLKAGRLIQLPTTGEFANEQGSVVIRQLQWDKQDLGFEGHMVLMRKDYLAECCRILGLSYGFIEYLELLGLDSEGRWDGKCEHHIERWTARFPSADKAPTFLNKILDKFSLFSEREGWSFDALVACCRAAELGGPKGLRAALREHGTYRTRPASAIPPSAKARRKSSC